MIHSLYCSGRNISDRCENFFFCELQNTLPTALLFITKNLNSSMFACWFLILFHSVIMTTASVVFSFGMMPLNLFIYSRSWTNDKSVIPYKDIVITLVSILLPVCLGVIIRYKLKKLAPIIVKVGIGKYHIT